MDGKFSDLLEMLLDYQNNSLKDSNGQYGLISFIKPNEKIELIRYQD